jgi:hypothetical protein
VRWQSEAATPLWIVSQRVFAHTTGDSEKSKAPSPLRSAGALQKVEVILNSYFLINNTSLAN